MKHLIILLLLLSCYHLTTAQVASDNGTTITLGNQTGNGSSNNNNQGNFQNISPQQIDNNPFILSLIDYGGQVVVGHVADSQLINTYYHTGNYTKIYAVSANEDNTLNLTADVQLTIYYGALAHAIFTVHYDPSNQLKRLISYSYEWQNYSLTSPNGLNISYNTNEDLFDVISFNGFAQSLNYINEDNEDQTETYNSEDYLSEFGNWTSLNTSSLYDNQTLQYSLNAALRGLRSKSYYSSTLAYNYSQLNVTVLNSIYTYSVNNSADYFRYDFEFNTESQKGRAVCVVNCPVYNQYYPPYWPPYYPVYPLGVNADGSITSTAGSENVGAQAQTANAEGDTAETITTKQGAPIPIVKPIVQMQTANGTDSASNGATATAGPIIIDTPQGPSYYYNYNCLYGNLDYYWFVEIQSNV